MLQSPISDRRPAYDTSYSLELRDRGRSSQPIGNAARAWRRFSANQLAVLALVAAVCLIAFAICAPLVSRFISQASPTDMDVVNDFAPASRTHWLGTDEYGRDVLTRIAYGARVSLGVAVLAVIIKVLIGTLAGAMAAYYGGWINAIVMRFVDVMLSIPTLFLLLLVGSLIRFGPVTLAVAIAIFGWAGYSRLIHGEILSVKQREYVEAARVVGATDRQIIARHILPNVTHIIIISATINVPAFILAEAALSYLGLGVQPPTPSWGNMMINSTQYLYQSKMLILLPGLFISATALSLTIIGNALRDALDPRLTG